MQRKPSKVLLTFDVEGWPSREDYFNGSSATCLRNILQLLEQENFQGVFFVSGSIAEQMREYPDIVERLRNHRIGYHSSAHNANPGIISLTDVPDYEEAVKLAAERETSHVNLLEQKLEGKGGLLSLRETFPRKEVECFRAPFFGWSPPHLEALYKLGIKYDFSTFISDYPVLLNGIVFYPIPIAIEALGLSFAYRENRRTFVKILTRTLLRKELTVLSLHPSALLLDNCFDRIKRRPRGASMIKFQFFMIKLLFKRIRLLQRLNLVQVTEKLEGDFSPLDIDQIDIRKIFLQSIQTPVELFNHNPKHLYQHFVKFFAKSKALADARVPIARTRTHSRTHRV